VSSDRHSEYVTCPRCNVELQYAGTKRLHEGTHLWGVLGGLFEALEDREALDLFFCPRCGRVEFFVDAVGEELRRDSQWTALNPEQLPEAPEPPAVSRGSSEAVAEPESEGEPGETANWQCTSCGAVVPHNFEICWNCGRVRGTVLSEEKANVTRRPTGAGSAPADAIEAQPEPAPAAAAPDGWTCPACGAVVSEVATICPNCCTPRADSDRL
jgi:uncharacterized C2H2 Zn-finger protein/RNA polymerase subunit RPABC4/transcription elongation factor Spt4